MSSAINHSKRSHRSYAIHKSVAESFSASRPAKRINKIDYSKESLRPMLFLRGLLRKRVLQTPQN